MENSIGFVPLHGIQREKIRKIRLLSDGSELKIANFWSVVNYPDVVFVELSDTPRLPDETDTVIKIEYVEYVLHISFISHGPLLRPVFYSRLKRFSGISRILYELGQAKICRNRIFL